MNRTQIEASALTTFDVAPDGSDVRLHVRDRTGAPASIVLPASCLNQLLMTLPTMVQMALRNGQGDDSLRLVHSLDSFTLELGENDEHGARRFILTLQTGTGFAVSFAASEDTLSSLARSLFQDLPAPPITHATSLRRS